MRGMRGIGERGKEGEEKRGEKQGDGRNLFLIEELRERRRKRGEEGRRGEGTHLTSKHLIEARDR